MECSKDAVSLCVCNRTSRAGSFEVPRPWRQLTCDSRLRPVRCTDTGQGSSGCAAVRVNAVLCRRAAMPCQPSTHHLDAKVGGLAGVEAVVVWPGCKGHCLQRHGPILQGVLDARPHNLGVERLQCLVCFLPDGVLNWKTCREGGGRC